MISSLAVRSEPEDSETCKAARKGKAFRRGSILALLVGTAISAALIAYHSFSAVYDVARRIGWGSGFIIALYFSGTVLNSLAWRVLFRSERPGLAGILLILRWIRDSINYLLPSAFLGGDIVGARRSCHNFCHGV